MGFARALPTSQTWLRILAADFARVLLDRSTLVNPRGRREGRVLTSHPRSAARNAHAGRTAQQHTGGANHSAFPARWSDGLCRDLPGAEFVLASLAPRIDNAVHPVGLARIFAEGLTVATTARTTRFCRTRIRWRRIIFRPCRRCRKNVARRTEQRRSSARGLRAHRDYPPCPRLSCRRCRVHRKPGSRKSRPQDRPSWMSRDGRHIRQNRISVKWNIFARVD